MPFSTFKMSTNLLKSNKSTKFWFYFISEKLFKPFEIRIQNQIMWKKYRSIPSYLLNKVFVVLFARCFIWKHRFGDGRVQYRGPVWPVNYFLNKNVSNRYIYIYIPTYTKIEIISITSFACYHPKKNNLINTFPSLS